MVGKAYMHLERILNQYSYVAVAAAVLLLITFLCWKFLGARQAIVGTVLTLILLIAFQSLLSTNSNKHNGIEEFEHLLVSGEPVLLILYSNF